MKNDNQKLYAVVFVGMMAAMIFVLTMFVKIPIATPAGPTMLKTSNILCLLAGMLFGGLYGGLAAGIGSMLYDLMDPLYVSVAPFTLVFFFLMAFLCGCVSNARGAKAQNMKLNALGAVLGASAYWLLNAARNVITLMIGESAMSFQLALAANSTKLATSAINAAVAIVCSLLLVVPLHKALRSAGVLDKMGR